ncbi:MULTISPECIES: TerC family protein [Micrococcaceae]|uniref:TerC family integral membrane protein YceF n=2 Tax=Paeniglutamicibacter gangotriensis TaxID=254787 RepID=M7NE97_9MICC|nr:MULTISPECIES: TerC family protein [Micrococcaceae]AXV46286.1 tellurium resistance protein TerC, integral membrane protein [Arthrobacter sp.]AXV46364.1 tellurium resistance protein TerC [Arthrobacter sp.]AXV46699.1 tellurium resistance protein TerC [Arthrobacter sp.]EMQ96798.1 TerC family integral membrane protein YceF [Paeniglutamicibacter gangotriensis Lz1y]KAA0977072.1 TerC family protein [Paeniglutamicibacter gangotriensis]
MQVSPLIWIITIAVTIVFFIYEFFVHVRKPHEPSIGESARWSVFYISLAMLFGVGIGTLSGWTYGGEYFAGYLTEKALSIDNLFVFLLVMGAFAVPKIYQQKVLMVGIIIALVLRGIFIAVGATLIENLSWIFYLFGALLLFLAYRQAFSNHESDPANNRFMRFVRRHLAVTDEYHEDKLTVKKDGKRFVTPMLLTIIAIGFVDLIFAVDSIPAIYGLTDQAYIVFTANVFALMGLRQLFFLIGGLLERLVYLSQGLAVILAFIGVKLVFHALHVNELTFINGGQPLLWIPEIPISFSLLFIAATITVATVASLFKTRGNQKRPSAPAPSDPSITKDYSK